MTAAWKFARWKTLEDPDRLYQQNAREEGVPAEHAVAPERIIYRRTAVSVKISLRAIARGTALP
jgi:hypothetical protein